ncbi:MAG: hydrolase, partial [Zetaproteobacteria bacterium CG_4_8_14_3_um_filter_59_5]
RDLYHSMPAGYDLFVGVRETLLELAERGYWLGIVTGKSHAGLQRVLQEFDLAKHFLVLRTSDHCASKPHPAMVLESMAEMGVAAAQTAVIGDALLDIQMARAAGVRSLGVSFGVAGSGPLLAAGAEAVIDDFSELLAYFPPLQTADALTTIRP